MRFPRRVPIFSALGLAAPFLCFLGLQILALLPAEEKKMHFERAVLFIFIPILFLFGVGLLCAVGGVIEAARKQKSMRIAAVVVAVNAMLLWLMVRQLR